MRHIVKTLVLSVALASPALAQMPKGMPEAPRPPKAADYPDSEIRPTLEWQELVDKANRYRMHQQPEDMARDGMSGMQAPAQSARPAMMFQDEAE